jgi:hypothetical protein
VPTIGYPAAGVGYASRVGTVREQAFGTTG